ncbi:hypothetical protein PoB_002716100 [Plakobranchus ocellatus]|uniref:Uncharacterized protein n=1 Tax=Plakobranchus ocellatus TaxID=259542 RepID=A0AAV3ZNK3_9GAST|nr:hypothetical protein PoB_002716100 [Plakobranchus ocellatus]
MIVLIARGLSSIFLKPSPHDTCRDVLEPWLGWAEDRHFHVPDTIPFYFVVVVVVGGGGGSGGGGVVGVTDVIVIIVAL